MVKYVTQRLLLLIPLLLAVSLVTFVLIQLVPGDPVAAQYGLDPEGMDPQRIQEIRQELGLNDPLPVQYVHYLGRVLHGDLGRSISTKRPVGPDILQRFPATMELAIASMIVVVLIAIPLGIISAQKRGSWLDNLAMTASLFGVSMPSFWVGVMLILLFALKLGWLPSVGRGTGVGGTVKSLILPALTLGTGLAGLVTRITRSSMLEVLSQDYMRTAHAKGLSYRAVLIRHGLPNALIPVITVLGVQFASLLSGAVIVETIFAWPGIGRFAVDAIWRRDYPVIMGTVLVFATIFVLANLAVDILYVFLDPRIRYDER
ncbi:MAG: ABC transporter permease [Ardenticatenaceae bacterium]|nr:ABC transporter permease [Ardenticatenaceae bacterium]